MPKSLTEIKPYHTKCDCEDCQKMEPLFNNIAAMVKGLPPSYVLKLFQRLSVFTIIDNGLRPQEDSFEYWDAVREVFMEAMGDAIWNASDGTYNMEVKKVEII